MARSLLVTVASKHGATAEIGQRIAQVLNDRGVKADAIPTAELLGRNAVNPSAYAGFVVGTSVYIGRARKETRRFLARHANLLASHPVWLFSSGPTDLNEEMDPRMDGFHAPASIQTLVEQIQPREIRILAGAIDPVKMKGLERWIISKVGATVTDARDWAQITEWAETIAAQAQSLVEAR